MLYSIDDANALIARGGALHIAGDAAALARLTRGNWIGGTIPYFLTDKGGRVEREQVFVTAMPSAIRSVDIDFVDPDRLADIPARAPAHGFSLVVIPAGSDAHVRYAVGAHDLPGIFETPIVGWIAGVHLSELGRQAAKVVNGRTGEAAEQRIGVMRAHLAPSLTPRIGIINLFAPAEGDRLRFPQTGFAVDDCWVNDVKASFYDYAKARRLDPSLPLVADFSGEMINVSFQEVDDASRSVRFYAPVVAGVAYRQAAPIDDYPAALLAHVAANPVTPVFSCNCILNYLYADLAGDRALSITGPATFGEIAYVLLNQTLVYLELLG
jgi:uncharacterized protein DUF6976